MEIYGIKKEDAEKEIKKINKLRANHYKYYTEKEWAEHSNYDICIIVIHLELKNQQI